MWRTFIQVMALTLTITSSFFLLRGTVKLTSEDIASLSSTYVGYNEKLARSFSSQKADTIVGFLLLFFAFIAQWANLVLPKTWDSFGTNKMGIFLAIFISCIVFFSAIYVAKTVTTKTIDRVNAILKE